MVVFIQFYVHIIFLEGVECLDFPAPQPPIETMLVYFTITILYN